jgi:hypothetical protein
MKAFKIAGIVALVIWMAWVSNEVRITKNIAEETCGLVTSKMVDGGIHAPVVCPGLANNEVKVGDSN